ncbi:sulfotransferase family protein [Lentisalinibacter salinarum]|uniref:sulfotransferase family protein n=1 Tax=Lentisalinibacter salinarum TaxID=2992239 RepID=UPI00386E7DC4
MNARLILLFGLPRSGTTWLGKIFDSHPRTLYRHEPDSVDRLDLPLLIESLPADSVETLRDYCRGIRSNRALKVVGKSPVFRKDYLGWHSLARYRLGVALSRVASRAGFQWPVPGTPTAANGESSVVWKSIESLGRLGAIMGVLPDARALHIVRHPCGFVASVERGETRNRFDDNSGASEDYRLLEMLLETKAGQEWGVSMADLRAMYPEERLAWRWAVFNDKAMDETQSLPNVMRVAYERLCESPMEVSAELLEFAGLDWSPQVERFVQASTSGAGESSYYSVFKNPRQAAWSWEQTLEQTRIERIIRIAARSRTWQGLGIGELSG